ncbi:MAG: hypothetical protein FJZ00_07215 [Candidatus Sericytochromatia bacterium]|uniref:Uncharacterized protein n=1 Tax=Candidatus Tanganyikabacteria bacterium TaxID=2961651 RepID=A0A938BNB1_9BACT|nr:hypothetical protein [Candidatus Tanganyikabacteria bacterium]
MMVDDGDRTEEVIAWGQAERAPAVGDRLNVAYLPKWNTFRGETRIQRVASAFETATPAMAVRPSSVTLSPAADVQLMDLRRKTWKGIAPGQDVAKVGLYCEEEPAEGVWLRPERPIPGGLAQVVCLDVPAEARQWRDLTSAALVVVLAWEGIRGAELSPETLQAVYQHLLGRSGVELFTAIEKAPVPLSEAQAAVQILREAGLMSNASGGWRLLEPPDGPIGLPKLAAYQSYRQARAFREKLDRATVEEARQLAGLPAVRTLGPVTV